MLVDVDTVLQKQYDFIIAGGGTAGLCLAARLSEDPDVSVLVLEAGQVNLDDPAILRPASFGAHFGQEIYDWGHQTVPQKHCNDKVVPWARGKGLGGSSAINFMCWIKPPREDIDDFEKLGNPGWNWANYEKYSARSETFVHPDPEAQVKHNLDLGAWKERSGGPLLTAFPGKIVAAELDYQQTLINVGIPVARDPLGGDPLGVYFAPNTVDPLTSTRSYAASAYYQPNATRPNLNVLVSAYVSRIITEDGPTGRLVATGVEFIHLKETYVAKAKKEVILSAGGLKSSQILELSGIGNRALLESLDIPVKLDLPAVGENVQEHIFVGVSWELKDDVSFETLDILRDPEVAAQHLELHKSGEGLFTTGIMGFAFTPLDMLSSKAGDITEAIKQRVQKNSDKYPPGLLEQYQLQIDRLERGAASCEIISFPGFFSYPNPPTANKKYISVLTAVNHAFSRGTIHCTSSDPTKDPAFDPRYFEEESDSSTFLEMVKFIRTLSDVPPFQDMIVSEVNPGAEVKTDEQLLDWMKANMSTTYHTAGALSMLPADKGGVVDPQLKVYGAENIRVVDLSIVPLHFAAHPVATVYAIAEQAADIIKGKL